MRNRRSKLLQVVLLTLSIVISISTASAIPNRYVKVVGVDSLLATSTGSSVVTSSRQITPVHLRIPLSRTDFVKVRLINERRFKGLERTNVSRILQGTATYIGTGNITKNKERALAGASFVLGFLPTGEPHLHGLIETRGSRKLSKRTSLLSVSGTLQKGNVSRLLLKDEGRQPNVACGTSLSTSVPKAQPSLEEKSGDRVGVQGFQQLEILLEGDVEFFSSAGSAALTELTQILSLTDIIFRRDLNVTLQPTIVQAPVSYSSLFRYGEDFELDFFKEMREKRPTFNEDLFAVITGKTPPDASLTNVAGIANSIGIVCREKSLSQTVVRRFGDSASSTFYTFAHEVGHLIGGEHDDALTGQPSTGFIMNSGTRALDEFLERFSQYSINQIGGYFAQNGACLVDVGDAPPAIEPPSSTPAPAPPANIDYSLEAEIERISRKDVPHFYAYNGDEPLGRTTVFVYKSGRTPKLVKQLRTRSDGSTSFKRAPRGKYFGVLSLDPSIISNVVTVRK
jgi:hypothetical protein